MTETEWRDAFQRDANPERELLWWERVAGCYLPLVAGRPYSPGQRQAAFNVISVCSLASKRKQLEADLEKLPDSVMDDLAAIVRQLGTVN
jgi:hypothetical protein